MWTWSLNWGDITSQIVIGTCPMTSADLKRIQSETGVSAVLSLQHDDCLAYWGIDYGAMCRSGTEFGLEMERIPIRDLNVPDMRRQLPAAISMLAHLVTSDRRTYVHCTAGLGRAPLTVLGYLILVENISPADAIRLILAGRPGAVPAWEAFYGACEDLVAINRHVIERRAYGLYKLGIHQDAVADWRHAQTEVLRAVLTDGPILKHYSVRETVLNLDY